MNCKQRIVYILQYIPVQVLVYVKTKMTKYCIVRKCTNNSYCKNVSFFSWLDLSGLGDSTIHQTKFKEKCNVGGGARSPCPVSQFSFIQNTFHFISYPIY